MKARQSVHIPWGFSLVELAIVLFIMGLLLQVSIEPLGMRLEHNRRVQAAKQLDEVRMHLRAHWVSYGHLPCPIVAGVDSEEDCHTSAGGVPAATLSIVGSVNRAGELLDPWGRALGYSVSSTDVDANDPETEFANSPDWLTAGEIARVPFTELTADLTVCLAASSIQCEVSTDSSDDLVAVVVSGGSTISQREQDNRDLDTSYISAPYSKAQPNEFDDQLIWLGRSELIYLALQSGWLL